MACRLQAAGDDVRLVALIDTMAPFTGLRRAVPAVIGAFGNVFRLKFQTQLLLARGCFYVMDLAEYCLRGNVREAYRTVRFHVQRALALWRFKCSHRANAACAADQPSEIGTIHLVPDELTFDKFVAHLWAYGAYRAKPYTGFVALFASGKLATNRPTPGRGWGRWTSCLREYSLPGDHETCVTHDKEVLAEKFQECLADVNKSSLV